MPTLKQLRCEIEWGSTQTPFPEYGTTYGDGVVETYIAVPDHSQPFAIHLRSNKYIAEGLAMLIFMDGDYQCNRNRLNLVHPEPGSPENVTKISLRVRQKEKALGDGTYIGRAWRFDRHNIGGSFQAFGHSTRTDASEFSVPLDRLPSDVDRQHFDELGTICVFVLRCRAKEDAGHRSATSSDVDDSVLRTSNQTNEMPSGGNTPSNTANTQPVGTEPDAFLGFMNDGAADAHHFGLDGEGPGPAEQKAWSWHTPHPSMAAGPGILSGYAPGQPQLAQTRPYGSYGHPSGFSQPLQSGPASNQDQQASHHPQRRVHFNDQLPQQSSGYGAAGPPYSEQDFSANPGHSQEREYPQQPGNYARPPQSSFPLPQPGSYGYPPQSEYTHQVPSRAPVPDGFANPSLANGGIPTAQDHSRGFPIGADWGYPPSMTSYQPIGYGVPGYSGWPSAAYHPAYAQPPWQGQSMPGPSYVTLPNFAASFQPSHPYPYPQSAYSGGPVAPIPPTASGHPGGGIWGPPPPGSQDPAKEENNQLDGQGNQNQDSTCNAGDPSNNNNDQALPKDDDNKIEAGDSGWNNTDTSGGQMDNWNNTNTQTEAPTNDWNRSTINTGQINNAEPSWNTIADTSTQVQDSWNTAPAAAQPNETPFTIPQQSQATATVTQGRPLYGPHGPYYGTVHGSTDRGLQADAGEEPPYDVPEDMPTTHQVKPGEGYVYVHKRRSPEYLDTLEEPYARFVFKYRTKEQIEKEIGIKIEDEPTGDEEKRKLQVMDKDEIIEMLLRAKIALGGKVPSPPQIPLKPDQYSSNIVVSTAIPAPAYNFLGYNFPAARSAKKVPPQGDNAGLGVLIPPTAPTAAGTINTAQNWGGNTDWANKNAAPAAAPAHWQQATTDTGAPSAAQPAQQQPAIDEWGARVPPAPQQQLQQTNTLSQPAASAQLQAQQAPPAVGPIQFGTNIQTYKPPLPSAGASDRPITPPGGFGARTAQSSNASDNGMAGWDQQGGAGGGTAAGGWGGAAATSQPTGGW